MLGVRALGALPYTGRPETAVSGAIKWYLNFPAATAYVNIGRLILGASCSVTFDIQRDSDVNIYLTNDNGDELRYIVGTGWQIRISGAYYTYPEASLTPPIGERFTVTFSRVGATTERSVQLNGGTIVTKATAGFNFWFNNIGQGVGGVYQAFKLYKVTVSNPSNTTYDRVFDADASAGSSLINTLTYTNNGILTGAGWSIPACWIPTLDTSVSSSLVNQAVNSVAKNYLRFTGESSTSGYISHPEALLGASTFDVEIDFVPRTIGANYAPVYSNNESGPNQRHAMYMWGSSRCEIAFIIGGVRCVLNAPNSTFTAGIRYKVNAIYDGSTFRIVVNGATVASMAASGTVGGSRGLIWIGANLTEVRAPFDLYGYKITQNGTLIRNYDPSGISSGTALLDTVSSQNGTQADTWPTDNSEYRQYIDTSINNPIVNQGVNGTAANFCVFNGTSYFTAPSLGNLHSGSPKIRINIKKFKWFGSSVQPIFWQGGTSWANREFVLRNNSNVGNIICGTGSAAGFTWSDLTNAFGDANLTCDEFGFELDGTVAKFYKNGTAIFTVNNVGRGSGRVDGALFFIGAQQNNDVAGSTAAINIVPSGTQYGNIEILINDVVVRSYKMPDNGSIVVDSVAGNNLTQRGTFTLDNNEWRQFIVYNTQSVASILKMWNGTAWVNAIIRYWNGSSWVDATVKRFNGTQFN